MRVCSKRRTSRWKKVAIGGAFLLLAGAHPALAEDELSDLLQGRWYEIEIIVFERLGVLDINTAEQLTSTAMRSWPVNLMRLDEADAGPPSEEDGPPETELPPLVLESEYCLGYPLLAEEDPIHPMFDVSEEALEVPLEDGADEVDEEAEAPLPEVGVLPETTPDPSPAISEPEPDLTPYDRLLADLAAFETELWRSSFYWREERSMEAEVKAINRNQHLRPIIHRRWRQAVPDRNTPQPIYLASEIDPGAPATEEGFAKVEGYLTVTVGRYLHFAPTLWYHADNLGLAPFALPLSAPPTLPPANRYMELRQSRRMRSEELHYIDHPKIGVIVRIDPITVPEALGEIWSALSESQEDAL